MTAPTSIREGAMRRIKVSDFVEAFVQTGLSAAQVEALDDAGWLIATRLTNEMFGESNGYQHGAPSDTTKRQVCRLMVMREEDAASNADPFEGLTGPPAEFSW